MAGVPAGAGEELIAQKQGAVDKFHSVAVQVAQEPVPTARQQTAQVLALRGISMPAGSAGPAGPAERGAMLEQVAVVRAQTHLTHANRLGLVVVVARQARRS